jgi:glycerol uptake facilitator-like aquaporin
LGFSTFFIGLEILCPVYFVSNVYKRKMFNIIAEFIGTFIFISVVLATGQAIPIGLALAAVIYFGGGISGGHFNPSITVMAAVKGSISIETAIGYVVAQCLAGLCALLWYNSTVGALKK